MRKFTWFILLINVLFLVLVIAIGADTAGVDEDCRGLSSGALEFCDEISDASNWRAIEESIIYWAAVDIVLGILWLVTNKNQRSCPVCGKRVKPGKIVCRYCGYDFAAAAGHGQRSNDPPRPPQAPS